MLDRREAPRPHGSVITRCGLAGILLATGCAPAGGQAVSRSGTAARPADSVDEDDANQGAEGKGDDVAAEPAAGGSAGLLPRAHRNLETVKASTYSHKTFVDEAQGVWNVDCSGYVDWLLAHSHPPAMAELRAATLRRPL